jgi:CBS domain-containing protein
MAGQLTVEAVMTRDVITVEPENTLREVIETLSAHNVSGSPVVSGGRVVGVISKSDVLDFLAATPGVPSGRVEFSEWGEVESAAGGEEEEDEASTAYYTDMWEDAGADVLERFAESSTPEWDLLAEYTAGTLMTRKLEMIHPEATVAEAARKLLDRGVHRLIVTDDDQLQGILSMTDLVRLVATGQLQ